MATEPSPVFHPSWPRAARTLVRRSIDRHGGWELWSRLEAITLRPASLRGLVPWLAGHGRTFRFPRSIKAFPKRGRTECVDFPAEGGLGVYDRGDVFLLDAASGRVTAQSRDHRRAFRGLRKIRRWGPLEALYFIGYAFAGYAAVPFVLPGLRWLGPVAARWQGERLHGARVELPPDWHGHSRVQSYFFDAAGLLRRHDYVVEVMGPLSAVAQGWEDPVTVEGLCLPARRTVLPRLGPWPLPFPKALSITFDAVAVDAAGP